MSKNVALRIVELKRMNVNRKEINMMIADESGNRPIQKKVDLESRVLFLEAEVAELRTLLDRTLKREKAFQKLKEAEKLFADLNMPFPKMRDDFSDRKRDREKEKDKDKGKQKKEKPPKVEKEREAIQSKPVEKTEADEERIPHPMD